MAGGSPDEVRLASFREHGAAASDAIQRANAANILKACGVTDFVAVNVLEDDAIRVAIKDYANWPTIPQLYIGGQFIGGSDIMRDLYQTGELQKLLAAARPH